MAEAARNLIGSVQGTAAGVIHKGQSYIDQRFPPDRRADVWSRISGFAQRRPYIAAFILAHFVVSGVPIALFALLTTTIVISSLLTALIISLLCAGTFIGCCIGVAFLFLIPTLFLTTCVASFIWLQGVATYWLYSWYMQRRDPRTRSIVPKTAHEIQPIVSPNDPLSGWNGKTRGLPLSEKKLDSKSHGVLHKYTDMDGLGKGMEATPVDVRSVA